MAKYSPLNSGTRLVDGNEKVGLTISREFQAHINQIEALKVKSGATDQLGIHVDDDGIVRIGDGVTNYTQFATDGEITLAGTAQVTRHIRIAATSWKPGVSAPSVNFVGVWGTIGFDALSDDEVNYSVIVPYRIAAGTTIDLAVDWCYEGGDDAGTVCWGIEYQFLAQGGAVDGTTTTILGTSAGNHTTGTLVRTEIDTGMVGALEGEILGMRLYRDISGDTLAADAELIQVHLHYVMDTLGGAT